MAGDPPAPEQHFVFRHYGAFKGTPVRAWTYPADVHGQVLCVAPIHGVERRFVLEHGWTALVERFYDQEIDVADFGRPPVVTMSRTR